MNERMKKITGQVLDELVPETWVALGYDKIKEIQRRTAELIVQEMCQVIDTELAATDIAGECEESWKMGMECSMGLIKEHFGVTE